MRTNFKNVFFFFFLLVVFIYLFFSSKSITAWSLNWSRHLYSNSILTEIYIICKLQMSRTDQSRKVYVCVSDMEDNMFNLFEDLQLNIINQNLDWNQKSSLEPRPLNDWFSSVRKNSRRLEVSGKKVFQATLFCNYYFTLFFFFSFVSGAEL